MSKRKAAMAALLSACIAGGLVATAAPAAQAAPRTACVNKKSGELRIQLKSKKCKKGWKKIAFDQPGAPGAAGPAGTAGPVHVTTVKDAAGTVVGQSLSAWGDLTGSVLMPFEGGLYWYTVGSGKVDPIWWYGTVIYSDAACSPTAAALSVYSTTSYVQSLSSGSRIVERPSMTLPARAYLPTSTVRAVLPGEKFWYRNGTGTCEEWWGWSPNVAILTAVNTPPDYVGPLSIS